MTKDYIQELDETLEAQVKLINSLKGEERAREIKNLETMNAIRTDIYQKQTDNYAAKAKVEQDDKKLEQDNDKIISDKKQSKAGLILNAVMTGVSAVASIAIPIWIMTAERRGEFFSNRSLNATEKAPKIQFVKLPIFKK